ncbi:MAG: hypothetical protein FWE03_00280 [Firmicutes bacterium]|nr:hypothetical protein [Bacillota bacterium]
MAKYVLTSDKQIGIVKYSYKDKTDEEVLKMMQENEPDANWTSCTKIPRGKHSCRYCGSIAEGTYEDLLCEDCRSTFGHSLFSEL